MKIEFLFSIRSFLCVAWLVMATMVAVCSSQNIFAQETIIGDNDDSAFSEQLIRLCQNAKEKAVLKLSDASDGDSRQQLLKEIGIFRAYCFNNLFRQQVREWNAKLQLAKLEQLLRQEDETTSIAELIDEILGILQQNPNELHQSGFVRLKNALSTCAESLKRAADRSNVDEVEHFYDSLPGLVESYCQSPDGKKFKEISESLSYLGGNDESDELAALIRKKLGGTNFRVHVTSDVVAKLVRRDINEPTVVRENILGTQVRGTGEMIATLGASFVPREGAAVIRVTLAGELKTSTTGHNGPVRIHSDNTTTVETVKDIILTPEGIATGFATTKARQLSLVNHVDYLRNGPLVRRVAPNQIRNRKPASDAESERLTRAKLNARVDKEVDAQVARWKNVLNNPAGLNDGLQLTFEQLQTTARDLSMAAHLGTRNQLGAMTAAPAMDGRGVFVQCHESLLRNAGLSELSGKTLVEEQIMADLKERFPKIAEAITADENHEESSLALTFSEMPIDVTFDKDCISVMVETASIEREGTAYPGMMLELHFRIERVDGGFQLVAVDSPEVLPVGFDKKNDQLSARETTIRAIVMKKLGRAFEKPIEWKTSTLEGENGTATLKPTHLSTTDGWLSVGFDLADWKPKTETNQTSTTVN